MKRIFSVYRMYKICLALYLLLLLCMFNINNTWANTVNELKITSKAGVVMEQTTGRILWEKNSNERLKIAITTKILTAVESALGITNAYSIATASSRIIGIALGAEDYCANLKTTRSQEGTELFYARSAIVVAARAAGIDALDTVYSNVNDTEGLIEQTKLIKQLGFDGKSIINPRQIAPINEVFRPTDKDIEKAIRIIKAAAEAEKKGSGVVSLDGKMVDKPVVMRAQRVITVARAMNIIGEEV